MILLIDHSGSMSGPKWEAADWAVQNLLAGLTPGDTFNLGLFHSTTRWFARQPVRGDERTIRQARDFLLQHKDSGGTELGVALEQALDQPRDAADRARHVVIVTDAQVSDAGRILALVEREAQRPDRRRVDVLCIDAAPNSGLANELAERGGGLARFLTSDPAENDIASALDEVLADWAAPILRNLTLQIDRPGVQAAGRRVSHDRGRRERNRPRRPAGRAGRLGRRPARRRLRQPVGHRADVPPARGRPGDRGRPAGRRRPAASHPAVAALFGARRVLDIELAQSSGVGTEERLRQLGYDPREVLEPAGRTAPIYAENARRRSTDALHDLLVQESLRYGIACSETAFVATRREAGEKVAGTVAVANALAHGWSEDFLMARTMSYGGGMPMAAPMAMAAPMSIAGADGPVRAPAAEPGCRTRAVRHVARGTGGEVGRRRPRRVDERAARRCARPRPAPAPERALPLRPGGRQRRRRVVPRRGVGAVSGQRPRHRLQRHAPSRRRRGRPVRLARRPATACRPAARSRGWWCGSAARLARRSIAGLTIALYVDDLTAPRARVRLADLIRQGGERPLNVRRQPGQVVRIVLLDPNGAWAAGAPSLEVALG